jgi:hypothetical protein
MPFKSEAQRRWMWANDPKMAQRWADHTPKGADLPKYVSDEKEKEKKAHFEGFCDRAAEFGLDKQASEEMYKLARPLGDIPEGPGPDMMLQALNQLASARAMVRPTEDTLDTYGLSRGGFQSSLKRIIDKTQDEEKYNLSDNAPDPRVQGGVGAALGALAGLGVNKAVGESDILHNLLYAGGGALLGGLAGAGKGALERRNYGQTAKLLKQYGMLHPQLLRQAYPLLADEYSFK